MPEILSPKHPDLEAIGHLRYEVYIREQQKLIATADHAAKRLVDSLDDTATHFVVRRNGTIVGAGRINLLHPSHVLSQRAGFGAADRLGIERVAYVSKTCIRADERGSELSAQLMRGMVLWAVSSDVYVGFCHCGQKLARIYERLGFRVLHRSWVDEFVGTQQLLAIYADDLSTNRHFQGRLPLQPLQPKVLRSVKLLRDSISSVDAGLRLASMRRSDLA